MRYFFGRKNGNVLFHIYECIERGNNFLYMNKDTLPLCKDKNCEIISMHPISQKTDNTFTIENGNIHYNNEMHVSDIIEKCLVCELCRQEILKLEPKCVHLKFMKHNYILRKIDEFKKAVNKDIIRDINLYPVSFNIGQSIDSIINDLIKMNLILLNNNELSLTKIGVDFLTINNQFYKK